MKKDIEKTILEKSKVLDIDAPALYKRLEESGFFENEYDDEPLQEEYQNFLDILCLVCADRDKSKFFLELTEKQVLDLFNLKRFLQDRKGVHFISGWNNLQDKDFIDSLINFASWYWKEEFKEYLEKLKENKQEYLPKDFGKEESL